MPEVRGQFNPSVKDLRFDPPVLMGRIDILSRDRTGTRVETAEASLFGSGFPLDASFTSEIIDVGTAIPRSRRYSRQMELFSESEGDLAAAEFADVPGRTVNWGKVWWRGRRTGAVGDIRLQFRTGNAPETHIYARRISERESDTRDEDGSTIDVFTWLKLNEKRVPVGELQYNELGVDLGSDGELGWSFWSAPFKLEDGLIDDKTPPAEWQRTGIPLPLPARMRYIQFRIFFDSTQESAAALDFLEFEYDVPIVSGGVLAEIFPATAPMGEEVTFRYFIRPQFADGEVSQFNRVLIDVPTAGTRVDSLKFDGRLWAEIRPEAAAGGAGVDPLLPLRPKRQPAVEGRGVDGEFGQAIVADTTSGGQQLLLKLPMMTAEDFAGGQFIEVIFRSRLFRAMAQFTSAVWNDGVSVPGNFIPQPTEEGDAVDHIATDGVVVVAAQIADSTPRVAVRPNPFTPNGDGINDDVTFQFDLFRILKRSSVAVDIRDLSGRQVRRLGPVERTAGSVELTWNGRDSNGRQVPPGLYLYRLTIGQDSGSGARVGTVALSY